MSDVLELRHISGGYGDFKIVRDVSLKVEAGSVTALFGPNGAGKTTSLRIAAGLNNCSSGSIIFRGEDVSRLTPYERVRRGLSMVQEGKRIFRALSVDENLFIGGYPLKLSKRAMRRNIEEAYGRFPILGQRRGHAAGSLSGGQQQMLAIAQALVSRPTVILLDEPSAGLAPSIVADVFSTLRNLKSEGLAILLVEQALDAALPFADQVTVIDLGRVVLSGDAKMPGLRDAAAQVYFGKLPAEGSG